MFHTSSATSTVAAGWELRFEIAFCRPSRLRLSVCDAQGRGYGQAQR